MVGEPIYLDHNASTPPAPEVVEAMLRWLGTAHANPSSEHRHGARAAAAVDEAKGAIAALIGADADDIFLTSGATEANNLVLKGYLNNAGQNRSLLVSDLEHKSVLETANALERSGVTVTRIPVDHRGIVSVEAIRGLVAADLHDRRLVSVMHANNEIGTVQPITDIRRALSGSGALLHSDAAQSVGKIGIDVDALGVDFLSLSAHKIYGPAGIGAVYVAPGLREDLVPIIHGGGQQFGLRPGTVPVFLAVGFGVACELARRQMSKDAVDVEATATAFVNGLLSNNLAIEVFGDPAARLPGLRSIRFVGVDANDLLTRLSSRLSASTGSACTAGELRPSHVLTAIGLDDCAASQVVRFGFGRSSSLAQAAMASGAVSEAVTHILGK